MGENEKNLGQEKKSHTVDDVKKELLELFTVQENERRLAILRVVELEKELDALKERVTFLKGATEGLKVSVQTCVNGPTPKQGNKEEKK